MTGATWLIVFAIGMAVVTIGTLVYVWFVRAERDDVLQHKAEEYVTDSMLAEKHRAGTRIDRLSDIDAAKELDEKFGGPK